MSPTDAIAPPLFPLSDTYSSGMSPTSSHGDSSFTPADALQKISLVQHKNTVPKNVDADNNVSEILDDYNADPTAELNTSAHGRSPTDAIASSLVLPSYMYSSTLSPASSHSDPFTPADALQMMSLVQDEDTLGNVESKNDPDVQTSDPDASAHGMSPADAIASSLVPPSDTYSSGISPTSSHITPSTPTNAFQMMPTQRKDVPENSNADNDVSELSPISDLDMSAHGMNNKDVQETVDTDNMMRDMSNCIDTPSRGLTRLRMVLHPVFRSLLTSNSTTYYSL
ncbi:hypothetical protein L226DRAFT_569750 [Lentinus tigrinus ALCF2SS1-7]|uniref:Uncharacterized protein n=1 Tax=Lentinus tigrinus ALCF2SS1-6 TaxID=1328759 RepID=A0A5C2SMH1_9APHY|nr:hypothetical protein L227DRAFT_607973 [Lentinus tigrinus ALCF2SS1-6]RPD76497.1 hypothetical protein L226DRAFT_569750 [Lentinus tigrinus ALCF2SS1-7]